MAKKKIKVLEYSTFDFLWRTYFQKTIKGRKRVVCEECLLRNEINVLGDTFVLSSCSHILPKGKYPLLRLHKDNVQPLCLKHHHIWDFGNKGDLLIKQNNYDMIDKLMECNYDISNTLIQDDEDLLNYSGYSEKEVQIIIDLMSQNR